MRYVNNVKIALLLGVLMLAASGCKTLHMSDPSMCSAIKDGSFAVATFGCMKITDLPSRDFCTKAALAGSILAQQACLQRLVAPGATMPEIGDPAMDDQSVKDAKAILNEWRALEAYQPTQGGAPSQPK